MRNRLIEYFEMASSYDEQAEYDEAAPEYVNVPYEIIEQFDDWSLHLSMVPGSSRTFSDDELVALRDYRAVWEAAAEAIGNDYPSLDTVQGLEAWREMTSVARFSHQVFSRRGRLPEDEVATTRAAL